MPREGDSLPQASRSMADITRLFMTGARPAPVRTPPGGERSVPATPSVSSARAVPEPVAPAKSSPITLNVFIGNWAQAIVAAATMAESQPLGVVGLCGGRVKIARVGPSANDAAPTPASHAPVEMQLARLLFMAKKSVGGWLIVVHPKERKEIEQLVPVAERWLVAGGTDNDGLIESYRTLKALYDVSRAQDASPAITLAFDSGDLVEAQRAFVRLSHVARSFLSQQLKFLFGRADVGAVAASEIADLPVADEEKTAAWASLYDFALDLADQARESEESEEDDNAMPSAAATIFDTPLHNLLDPEERAALTAGFGEDLKETPAEELRSVVKKQDVSAAYHVDLPKDAPDAIPVAPTSAPARVQPPKAEVIHTEPPQENKASEPVKPEPRSEPRSEPRVVRYEPAEKLAVPASLDYAAPALLAVPAQAGAVGATLWSSIEPAVAALAAGHTILEARPPKQLASLLTVDSLGRLHVWMLADPADPTAYARVWQWAGDHRQLIALTRRDVKMDGNADAQLHLVLPQGMTLVHAGQPGFERLRIHNVRFGNQQGVVLVPVEM